MKLFDELEPEELFPCGPVVFKLSDIRALKGVELRQLSSRLWVAEKRKNETWIEVSFLEGSADDSGETLVGHFFTTSGTLGTLREARHSYFGEECEGYVFYMNFKHMRQALNHLEKYFDGD